VLYFVLVACPHHVGVGSLQGGPYREYDIMVWDAKEGFTQRMTVDSMFTVDRQTYQDTVEFNVGDSRITV
jgi:hypothetical protein